MTADPTAAAAVEVVLHEQHLQVGTVQVPVERVVLRRRVTTQVRQVEVTVRREELEVHRLPVQGDGTAGPHGSGPPVVIVLSEEVPVVHLHTRPYERVTVRVDAVRDAQEVTAILARERAEVTTDTAPGNRP